MAEKTPNRMEKSRWRLYCASRSMASLSVKVPLKAETLFEICWSDATDAIAVMECRQVSGSTSVRTRNCTQARVAAVYGILEQRPRLRTSSPRRRRLSYGPALPSNYRAFCVYSYSFVTILIAPAPRVSIRNPRQLDPANSRGRNCFAGECRRRPAHRRFRRSPRKNSHKNESQDVSRR
jgi:hypothetical protein